MKVIDLLNKIANGEDVPKVIKFLNYKYAYDTLDKEYQRYQNGICYGFGEDRRLDIILNDKVEIIEDTPNEDINVNLAYIDKEYLLDNKDVEKKINEIINRHNILVDKVVDVLDKVNGDSDDN